MEAIIFECVVQVPGKILKLWKSDGYVHMSI